MTTKEMTTYDVELPQTRDPFRNLRSMTDILGDMFAPARMLAAPRAWMPSVDVHETEKEFIISASLPGVKKEDVKVALENGVLTIAGERKTEKEDNDKNWLRRETTYGSFERSFVVPSGLHPEDIKAMQKDGLLTVRLPKPEAAKSRSIGIKVE